MLLSLHGKWHVELNDQTSLTIGCSQFQSDQLITIILTNSTETFSVQKALLCNVSEYFAKALKGRFNEAKTRALTLPDCDIDTVQMFLYWLCNLEVPNSREMVYEHARGSETRREVVSQQQLQLIRLWCFGDRFLIPRLQNAAVRDLVDLLDISYIRAAAMALVFNTTHETSPLRALAVHSFLVYYPTINAYGEQTYSEDALNMMGGTPGVLAKCFEFVATSKCGRLKCECSPCCYKIVEIDYMVPEDDPFR